MWPRDLLELDMDDCLFPLRFQKGIFSHTLRVQNATVILTVTTSSSVSHATKAFLRAASCSGFAHLNAVVSLRVWWPCIFPLQLRKLLAIYLPMQRGQGPSISEVHQSIQTSTTYTGEKLAATQAGGKRLTTYVAESCSANTVTSPSTLDAACGWDRLSGLVLPSSSALVQEPAVLLLVKKSFFILCIGGDRSAKLPLNSCTYMLLLLGRHQKGQVRTLAEELGGIPVKNRDTDFFFLSYKIF